MQSNIFGRRQEFVIAVSVREIKLPVLALVNRVLYDVFDDNQLAACYQDPRTLCRPVVTSQSGLSPIAP